MAGVGDRGIDSRNNVVAGNGAPLLTLDPESDDEEAEAAVATDDGDDADSDADEGRKPE